LAIDTCEQIIKPLQSVIKNKSDFMAIVKICGDIKAIIERVTEDDLQGSTALSQLNMCAKSVSPVPEIANTMLCQISKSYQ